MNILELIREDYRTLRAGVAGDRFRNYVHKRRGRRCNGWSVSRALNCSLGIVLIGFGLAIGWLPGPGGFLAIVGLAIVAQEIPIIGNLLDSAELLGWRLWGFLVQLFRSSCKSIKAATRSPKLSLLRWSKEFPLRRKNQQDEHMH